MAVVVNQEICTGCGICIKACPEPNVIKRVDGGKKATINKMFCKMCLLCASACPPKAITSEG
ncbi:MAG: 4Fe-4S binding protein [Chitinispirillia bacterium]|nr:4Fe-4S binding protein [Chitinispirillia bacterium]MCL2268298.1 4Fe-4S binding protein [Chitinispirillia bacterium]